MASNSSWQIVDDFNGTGALQNRVPSPTSDPVVQWTGTGYCTLTGSGDVKWDGDNHSWGGPYINMLSIGTDLRLSDFHMSASWTGAAGVNLTGDGAPFSIGLYTTDDAESGSIDLYLRRTGGVWNIYAHWFPAGVYTALLGGMPADNLTLTIDKVEGNITFRMNGAVVTSAVNATGPHHASNASFTIQANLGFGTPRLTHFENSGTYTGVPPVNTGPKNVLTKNLVRVETLSQHDVPGTPYVPAKAGYYTYDTQQSCGWIYPPGQGHWQTYYDPISGETVTRYVPNLPPGAGGAFVEQIWSCTPQQVKTYHPGTPEQPATPGYSYTTSEVSSGFNLGWNSGARSIDVFFKDVTLAFKVGVSNVGSIVGLNIDDGTPVDYSGNTINYGFYCSHGTARVMRNGTLDPAGGAFTYDADTVFRIKRVGTNVTFSKDGTTTYTVAGAPTGAGWMEAALYSGNDVVYDPVFEDIQVPAVTSVGSTLTGVMPYMHARFTQGQIFEIDGVLSNMTASLRAGSLAPTYALLNGDISVLSALFASLTGEIGQINASFLPMDGLWADHAYGAIEGVMQPMDGWLLATQPQGIASFGSFGWSSATLDTKHILFATFLSNGKLSGVFSTTITESAEFLSRATLTGALTFTSIQQAVLWGIATTVALAKVPEGDVETWVVNFGDDTHGSTQYQNYDYNSYACIDGRYYGASADGLALLEGDTDDGAPIASVVSLGKVGGSIRAKKTFQECFLGVSAQGNLFVKVIAEGKEYIYKTRDFDPEMQVQRATFGKGLRTNYVTLEIYNEDGADFELDTVQFTVADMTRKI